MRFFILFWAVFCISVIGEECTHNGEHATCKKREIEESEDENPMPCFLDERPRLYRWDPVKIGHKRRIQISPGHEVDMITRAMKPVLFEIPNFLTDDECDALIALGKSKMMMGSQLHDVENRAGRLVTDYEDLIENIHAWDRDGDHMITTNEVIQFAKKYKHLYITTEEVIDMFTKHNIKPKNKDFLTKDEFHKLPFKDLHVFFAEMKVQSPKHRDRYSYQVWIHHRKTAEPIVKKLQKRVEKITKLTEYQIRAGEPLQIVKYIKDGIFNTHHDSQDKEQFPDLKCCHLDVHAAPKCRLCRFITIMYYLNTMDEGAGGETAFNLADRKSLDAMGMDEYLESGFNNLRHFCHKANLVLKPVKGTAIMWYNHFINEETGWLGKTDVYAIHGGCPVLRGEKWIANVWVTATDAEQAHLKSDFHWED